MSSIEEKEDLVTVAEESVTVAEESVTLAEEYKILHPVFFTYTVQEAVAFDATEKTYWIEKKRKPNDAKKGYVEEYLFYPLTEELYEEFFMLRKDFCERSGEPFYQGDPFIVRAVNVNVSSNTFVGKAEHVWNFNAAALRNVTPFTVPATLITNLDVPLKVIHA